MQKNHKKSKQISKKIVSCFDIPGDVIFDIPRITVCDNTEIRIENYKTVLEYDETAIKFACKDKFINIIGQNLNITVITDDEISVKGILTSITFA